jgi:hypothetical protein
LVSGIECQKIRKKKDRHLRLELDTEDLYNAFQRIKQNEGIRSNTDILRWLIKQKAKEYKQNQ